MIFSGWSSSSLRQGGEGVDVKEGSEFNVVEYNEIYGEIDAASAGASCLE